MDKFVDKITKYLVKQCVITAEDEEVYFYSFKVVFLIVMTIILVLAVSIYMDCLLESIIFLAFLAPLRTYAGGYHAESPWVCLGLYVVLNFASIAVSKTIPMEGVLALMLTALPLSLLTVFLLAPVAAQNKPLLSTEIKKYRKISIHICLSECAVIVAFFVLMFGMPEIYLNGTLGILVAAISIIVEKIRKNMEGGDLSYEIKREL